MAPGESGPTSVASPTGDRCLRSGSGLYCGGQGVALTRLDTATGRPVWPDPPKGSVTDIIGVSDGFLQAVTEVDDGEKTRLVGYRLSDGKQEWWTDIGGAYQGATFVRGRGHAVLVQDWDAETFQAVDARTGEIKWSQRVSKHLSCRPSVQNGHPYAECGPLDTLSSGPTELYALDPGSGEPRRIVSLPSSAYLIGVRGGEALYLEYGGQDDSFYTALLFVDPASGRKRRVKLSPPIPSAAVVPSLTGDTLYFVRQNGEVTAVTTGGERLWSKTTGVERLSAPAVSARRGALYLAAASGRVVALNRTDGRVLWREKPRTDPGGSPADVALTGDALYVMYGYDTAEVFSIDVTERREPEKGTASFSSPSG